MLRDHSVEFHLTRTERTAPDECVEVEFIVRAGSVFEVIQLAAQALEQDGTLSPQRIFEVNAQEIERLSDQVSSPAILRGPLSQLLVCAKRKKIFGII